jgi:hypothetical protein
MKPLVAALCFSLFCCYSVGLSQEANLWNQQYGTRSTLLGGSVIGSVSDMSATYYNPGTIALFREASLLLSAKGYEYSQQVIEGGAGDGRDLTSSSIKPLPDLVASSLPFDWLGEHSLAFSILIRKRIDTDIQTRGQVSPLTSGGLAAAELIATNELDEFWGGLTWSTRLSEQIGIGMTMYLAVRNQDRRTQFLQEELDTSGSVATSVSINQYSYQHYRLLWKAGLGVNLDPLTLGATITTPGLAIVGSGSVLANASSSGFDYDGDGTDDDVLIAAFSDDQPVEYHSSWSFGLGGAYRFGKTRIHVSGEYIAGVDFFEVMGTGEFIAQSTGQTVSSSLTHETDDVINYAVGLEYAFGEKTTGYMSFSTDFAAAIPGSPSTLSLVNYDIYHVGVGAAFNVARWDLVVGGVYAFGSDKLQNAITPISEDVSSELIDRLSGSDVVFSRIRILFGFSYAL